MHLLYFAHEDFPHWYSSKCLGQEPFGIPFPSMCIIGFSFNEESVEGLLYVLE